MSVQNFTNLGVKVSKYRYTIPMDVARGCQAHVRMGRGLMDTLYLEAYSRRY